MAILKILGESDELLRKKSKKVDEITPRIKTILDDMKQTLINANGVGLAAVQVGFLRRMYIIDISPNDETESNIVEFINPEIIHTEGEQEDIEGCLSMPGKYGYTRRPEKVTVKAQNRNGEIFEYTGEGLFARCLCHEYDHLNGVLYTDHAIEMIDPEE